MQNESLASHITYQMNANIANYKLGDSNQPHFVVHALKEQLKHASEYISIWIPLEVHIFVEWIYRRNSPIVSKRNQALQSACNSARVFICRFDSSENAFGNGTVSGVKLLLQWQDTFWTQQTVRTEFEIRWT